jgi:RNA polymerase sigma factor (sigma-70 family)
MSPLESGRTLQTWRLNKEALDKLLAALDPDRDRAGELYEKIRSKLMDFFRFNGRPDCEDLVDQTLDRVARRLSEQADVQHFMSFVRGVARNLLLESHRKNKNISSIEEVPAPFWDRAGEDREAEAEAAETMRCLEQCSQMLPEDERNLIREYYQYDRRQKIDNKQRLADAAGLSVETLRVKAFRIRKRLQKCVFTCTQRAFPAK